MVTPKKEFKVIAHRARGFGEEENTLAALKKALASDVDEVEIDYRISKDRELICSHKFTYKDEYGRSHWIAKKKGTEATRNGLMTLECALETFRKFGKGKRLQIDVKRHGEEAQLVRLIKKQKLERRVIIVSWITKTLEDVHVLAPELRLSFSFPPKIRTSNANGLPNGFAARLPRIVREEKIPLATVNLRPLVRATASIIRRLQKRGLNVVVVNADTIERNERLRKLNVYGSMTNNPKILLKNKK